MRRQDGTEYTIPYYQVHDFFKKPQEDFRKKYGVISGIYDLKNLVDKLKPKAERRCRYCGKSHPEVTFRKDAHQMPRLIGTKYALTDEECDECNEFFGTYESDLANFIGVEKTFNKVKSISKKLKYTSRDKNTFAWDNGKVLINGALANVFEGIKNPYSPYTVYRALLKVAISLLPASELDNYRHLIKFLRYDSDTFYETYNPRLFDVMHTTIVGEGFNAPSAFLYKKNDMKERCLTHTVVINALNSIFQIYLFLNPEDDWLFDNENKITHHICPPMIDKSFFDHFGMPRNQLLNMYSKDKIFDDKENLTIAYNTEPFQLKVPIPDFLKG